MNEERMTQDKGQIIEENVVYEADSFAGKREYYRRFVGENSADVYEKKFEKLENGRISWNWCAFLVTPWWLLYRRMYKWFVLYVLVAPFFPLISNIVGGLIGDRIYKSRADKYRKDGEEVAIATYGGTSGVAIIVGIVIIPLTILWSYFIGSLLAGLANTAG